MATAFRRATPSVSLALVHVLNRTRRAVTPRLNRLHLSLHARHWRADDARCAHAAAVDDQIDAGGVDRDLVTPHDEAWELADKRRRERLA